LAALLDQHRCIISEAWSADLHALPGTRYEDHPLRELRSWTDQGIAVAIEALARGSANVIDPYLLDVAQTRLHMGFGISEVIQGLLCLQEAVLPVLETQFPPGSPIAREMAAQLSQYQRFVAGRFGHLFSEALTRDLLHQQRRAAVIKERQRLATELHDSVTQTLYSVTLYAEAARLAAEAGKQDILLENLEELQAMAREAMLDMRMLIFELNPPKLEQEGLEAALRVRLASVESRAGLKTKIVVQGSRRLPLAVEEELFWIALEAFNNVTKHARATWVVVVLAFGDNRVRLEIADDGRGFDVDQAAAQGGMGLRGIRERTERIDGVLNLQSTVGKGTVLTVTAEG
jgi:signal transduction histidine kinase